MRSLIKVPACATALVAVLSGCGLTGGDDGDNSDGGDGEQNGNVESGAPAEAEEVIGEADVTDEGTEATIEINGFTERGDLLQMTYTITPTSGDSSSPTIRRLFSADAGENMYLVDTANLRRHTVVEDDSGNSLEPNPWDTGLTYDEPTTLTAFFASAEDMEKVDVYLYDLPPILDVPVTTSTGEDDE
ncbi:hypothetical protein F4561_002283 [Lipingzhangella halophila]|uniref:Uncharacterized protein n=1 Tax=Lipingzhangella halophila TaxID=1783352 RepID=A0A7W7RGZ6_9ACTN|nr:hypothetical protein [Lipingzhangella halophila]MBB4931463.1 hypothetical protein [Lipingzhangella halophila]